MIAVISSGDQEGPHPPEKHCVALGTSNTSTITGVVIRYSSGQSDGAAGACSCTHSASCALLLQYGVPTSAGIHPSLERNYRASGAHSSSRAPGRSVARCCVDTHVGHVVSSTPPAWAESRSKNYTPWGISSASPATRRTAASRASAQSNVQDEGPSCRNETLIKPSVRL